MSSDNINGILGVILAIEVVYAVDLTLIYTGVVML